MTSGDIRVHGERLCSYILRLQVYKDCLLEPGPFLSDIVDVSGGCVCKYPRKLQADTICFVLVAAKAGEPLIESSENFRGGLPYVWSSFQMQCFQSPSVQFLPGSTSVLILEAISSFG